MTDKYPLKTEEREKVAIWLDNTQLAALRLIQKTEMVPVSASIRKAIDEYLGRRKKSREKK